MPFCPEYALPPAVETVLANLHDSGLSRYVQISVSDARGRILYVSQGFAELMGFAPEALVGQDYRLLASGLHDGEFFDRMWAQLRAGQDWRGEIANRTRTQQRIWLDLTIFPIPCNGGAELCYVGVSSDVTERRNAEAAHRKKEAVLAQILEGDPVPTFVIDARHTITHWNRALEVITGIEAARMIGSAQAGLAFYGRERPTMADLIVDGYFQGLEEYYHDCYRRSAVVPDAYEAEGFFQGLGERGRWLFFTATPLRDGSGEVIGAIETLQDITERKEAEASLKHLQAELEELVSKRTAQLAQAKGELEADIQKRERSESELLRRNGELTELNERLRTAQAQLAQSERLASIGQLAAGVAHEINNPIGYVQSNLGSLETYLQDLFEVVAAYEGALAALPAEHPAVAQAMGLRRRKDLDFLKEDVPLLLAESKEGIARVRKIVADLKDFSRVDTSLEWQWADLRQGLESTLNIVNNEIKYKAEVRKDYAELPEIECLPSQLNQVFMNLLVNAAHAMGSERGVIDLRTGREGADKVWIEVSDTGCGIAPENLPRIFDPFFTTKPVGKGTGLGLSLSYGIVQKHGGQIQVRSVPGQGTTFRIVLPIHQTGGA